MNQAHASEPEPLRGPRPATAEDATSDDDRSGLSGGLQRLVEAGKDLIRERPLAAVGTAAAAGFVIGSLTPGLVARPIGHVVLRHLMTRFTKD